MASNGDNNKSRKQEDGRAPRDSGELRRLIVEDGATYGDLSQEEIDNLPDDLKSLLDERREVEVRGEDEDQDRVLDKDPDEEDVLGRGGEPRFSEEEIERFQQIVRRRRQTHRRFTPRDIADDFFFWFESEESLEQREAELLERERRSAQEDARRDRDELRGFAYWWEKLINQHLRGDQFWYERANAKFIEEKADELKAGYLTSQEKIREFKYACSVRNRFMAQSYLYLICTGGDFTEQLLEDYYRAFYRCKRNAPVYASKFAPEREEDLRGEEVEKYREGWIGDMSDMWFEMKLRKDTATKGGRPDVYHSGPREFIYDSDANIVGVAFKSPETRAADADGDMLMMSGRRHEIPPETHLYNTLINERDVENTRLLLTSLKEKVVPRRIAKLELELMEANSELKLKKELVYPEASKALEEVADRAAARDVHKELEKKVKQLKKKLYDEKLRLEALKKRLAFGVKQFQLKSLLLDPDEYDHYIIDPHTGERVYEYELAAELGVRKYWQARSRSDVRRIIDGEHLRGIERQVFEELMSDVHRAEFFWSSQHHRLGTRRNREYDRSRDGAYQLWIYMNESPFPSRPFAVNSRRFEVVTDSSGEKRVLAYDDDDVAHLLDKSIIDPENEDDLMNFYVHDPLDPQDSIYKKIVNSPVVEGEKVVTRKADLSEFAYAFTQGEDKAAEFLEENYDSDELEGSSLELKLEEVKKELQDLEKNIKEHVPHVCYRKEGKDHLISDQKMEQLRNIIQKMVDEEGYKKVAQELQKAEIQRRIAGELGLEDEKFDGLVKALKVFSEQELKALDNGFAALEEMNKRLEESKEILKLKHENETEESFAKRIEGRIKMIDNFLEGGKKGALSLERLTDTGVEPTRKERNKIENELAILPLKTEGKKLWELLQELRRQRYIASLALTLGGYKKRHGRRREETIARARSFRRRR